MKYEGKIFKTSRFGNVVVTKYIDYRNVHIKFVESGYETIAEMGAIKHGNVKDRSAATVFGIGVLGDAVMYANGKQLREYDLWQGMLRRCFDSKLHARHNTYIGCTVSEKFRYYPYFKDWCNNQEYFYSKDNNGRSFQLDKDILVKGNKIYSEDTCCFVPSEVNSLLVKRNNSRGVCTLGVYFNKTKGKFVAQLNKNGKLIGLGYFDFELEAFSVYKEQKECHIKEVANKWKDKIDPRVYEALMNYQVEITD